jgi:hypothetical protein
MPPGTKKQINRVFSFTKEAQELSTLYYCLVIREGLKLWVDCSPPKKYCLLWIAFQNCYETVILKWDSICVCCKIGNKDDLTRYRNGVLKVKQKILIVVFLLFRFPAPEQELMVFSVLFIFICILHHAKIAQISPLCWQYYTWFIILILLFLVCIRAFAYLERKLIRRIFAWFPRQVPTIVASFTVMNGKWPC